MHNGSNFVAKLRKFFQMKYTSTQCWPNIHSFFFCKNIVFSAQVEYSYFSADFRLKIKVFGVRSRYIVDVLYSSFFVAVLPHV